MNNQINNDLETIMILISQEIGLKLNDSKKQGLFDVQKFGDIGLA